MVYFITTTDCTDCPCRNDDYERGSKCNIGYNMSLEYRKDRTLIYCSDNCKLVSIKFGADEFIKHGGETTKIRPKNWM